MSLRPSKEAGRLPSLFVYGHRRGMPFAGQMSAKPKIKRGSARGNACLLVPTSVFFVRLPSASSSSGRRRQREPEEACSVGALCHLCSNDISIFPYSAFLHFCRSPARPSRNDLDEPVWVGPTSKLCKTSCLFKFSLHIIIGLLAGLSGRPEMGANGTDGRAIIEFPGKFTRRRPGWSSKEVRETKRNPERARRKAC